MTDAQTRYNEEHDVQGLLGHPAGMEWFCRKHAVKARQFSHLTLGEAIPKLYEQQSPGERWMRVIYTLVFSHR